MLHLRRDERARGERQARGALKHALRAATRPADQAPLAIQPLAQALRPPSTRASRKATTEALQRRWIALPKPSGLPVVILWAGSPRPRQSAVSALRRTGKLRMRSPRRQVAQARPKLLVAAPTPPRPGGWGLPGRAALPPPSRARFRLSRGRSLVRDRGRVAPEHRLDLICHLGAWAPVPCAATRHALLGARLCARALDVD